ncbi:hypothetical protein NDI76_14800 [Halogeometricum sp. S1BR25-6]|uniref:Peptidase M23 domain-containing protein n=1 Tax=Halogeometricum salsisoli TaxID=2950536 RepID=A0ABU2GIB7_9EURY|nr:hypothetical protein [Halogeometricum sp. S1BR25-6]MDS0300013.1 hypothetical protein [Halogeometricum sp. S1BR25-6]
MNGDGERRTDAPPTDAAEAVTLPESTLRRYRRFSLYNSPYPAHDRGRAVDLYPATNEGLSPVAGEVLETRTVRAPPKPYAHQSEYLILVDSGEYVARILHVDPTVEAGDRVEVGDSLGPMIRSGFFAPWVANHVHVGFRRHDQNLRRASGSLPVVADVSVEPLAWDGVGTVVETAETYALLDAPAHPAPGRTFAGIATDDGRVLDGGFAHYAGGGVLTRGDEDAGATGPEGSDDPDSVSFLGHPVGEATGRDVAWRDVEVLANGERITGLSLFAAVDPEFGAKLVCPGREFAVGEEVRVSVRDTDDPVRLG